MKKQIKIECQHENCKEITYKVGPLQMVQQLWCYTCGALQINPIDILYGPRQTNWRLPSGKQ